MNKSSRTLKDTIKPFDYGNRDCDGIGLELVKHLGEKEATIIVTEAKWTH